MSRADLEAAAEEKYPDTEWSTPATLAALREAYIRGRLDQAEADAQIARSMSENEADGYYGQACFEVAAAIRKGSSDG